LPPSGAQGKARDPERILSQHRLPPEIRDSASERSAPRKAARWAGAATCAALWPGNTVHPDGGLGSGRLPVVGAAEGAVADLDAVEAKAVSAERSDGAATSVHQSPADRPTRSSGRE